MDLDVRYVFFGTPDFAESILRGLIKAGMTPSLVVCNPDRPVGRKKIMTPPPTKVLAQKHGIDVYQPEELDYEEWNRKVGTDYDFGILAAYGNIVSPEIIQVFPKGIIGVHPSLLPKHRGPTPIRTAILSGDKKTGVSLFLMDDKVDHGPVISQQEYPNQNYGKHGDVLDLLSGPELKMELANVSVELLVNVLPEFIKDDINPTFQNHSEATYTEKFSTEDAKIDYQDILKALKGDKRTSEIIDRKIRAFREEPGAWTVPEGNKIEFLPEGKRTKLLKSELKDGRLIIREIQVSGETPKEV